MFNLKDPINVKITFQLMCLYNSWGKFKILILGLNNLIQQKGLTLFLIKTRYKYVVFRVLVSCIQEPLTNPKANIKKKIST